MPDAKAVAAMMKYNEALQKAGVLLALEGLHPPSMGARVSFPGGKPKVTDGPFAEAKEVRRRLLDDPGEVARPKRSSGPRVAPRRKTKSSRFARCRRFADFTPDVQEAASGFEELKSRADQRKTA